MPRTATKKTVAPAKTPETAPIIAAIRKQITEAIPGVTLVDAKSGKYVTIKLNGKTLGYVNLGARVVRVDFPQRDGERKRTVVSKTSEVAGVVKQLASFAPAEKPVAPAKPKTRAKAASTKAKSTSATKGSRRTA